MSNDILRHFYRSIIESVITFGINCWGGNITSTDKQTINKVIKRSERIIGEDLERLDDIYERISTKKANQILKDITHPLKKEYIISGRSGRFLTIQTRTERRRSSFIPSTARMLAKY